MPITGEEFESGQVETTVDVPDTTPVGEYDSERNLVLAFLDENPEAAFTEREVLLGVDFDESDDPSTVRESYETGYGEALGDAANEVVDLAGDLTATTLVLGDVDDALTSLVAEGTVERADVVVGGDARTYYRVARS
ncbi:hypothetical protein [Halomarina oriensis]|uniref:Uncharacterized protein n=1 Tax=Halomarina oriensis TaxID=671145 RepID=A0A6B0GPJ2_9EURY|nr:hypothetical protein [Halomarina oriensis]MWG35921.1 hypothetical protein [Halomarina oriensis]